MTDTLAIIGSCASEDWIHYRDLSSAFRFALPPLRQHSSLLSIVSKPCAVPEGLCEGMTAWEAAQLRCDFDKSFLLRLKEAAPRVLIVDFAIDALSGVVNHGEGWNTKSYLLRRSPLFAELQSKGTMTARSRPEIYFREFGAAARILRKFMNSSLPDCKVILHEVRFAETVVDRAGAVTRMPERTVAMFRAANQTLAQLEDLFQRNVPCDVVSLQDETWNADPGHMWGMGGMHFERRYYVRFNAELQSLMSGSGPSIR